MIKLTNKTTLLILLAAIFLVIVKDRLFNSTFMYIPALLIMVWGLYEGGKAIISGKTTIGMVNMQVRIRKRKEAQFCGLVYIFWGLAAAWVFSGQINNVIADFGKNFFTSLFGTALLIISILGWVYLLIKNDISTKRGRV